MAHQCDVLPLGERLDEAQGELLPVVLDGAAFRVDGARRSQLADVFASEGGPGDLSVEVALEQRLGRAQGVDPGVVAIRGKAPAAETSGEDAKAVLFRIDGALDAFDAEHGEI